MFGQTLEEVLQFGRGIERPFLCPSHADMHASASVNVAKNVWFCFSCSAKGRVDGKRVPTDAELAAMLRPEQTARAYPLSWLGLFTTDDSHWHTRFPGWLCDWAGLGEDPITGDATFPVHTPDGRLAGVGRRRASGEPRYLYPPSWSASRTLSLLGARAATTFGGAVLLVEGYADACACWQVGAAAFACWGAGVHFPQREIIARMGPKVIVTAFDADDAGQSAAERAADELGDLAEIVNLDWSPAGKDPAEAEVEHRSSLIVETVRRSAYGRANPDVDRAMASVAATIRASVQRKE